MKYKTISEKRKRRRLRTRNKIRGTAERPRMCVSITNKHIYVQIVNDDQGAVLASAATAGEALAGVSANMAAAEKVGKLAAEAALQKGIKSMVFDRGGRKYHGRLKTIAEAARAAGITI